MATPEYLKSMRKILQAEYADQEGGQHEGSLRVSGRMEINCHHRLKVLDNRKLI